MHLTDAFVHHQLMCSLLVIYFFKALMYLENGGCYQMDTWAIAQKVSDIMQRVQLPPKKWMF